MCQMHCRNSPFLLTESWKHHICCIFKFDAFNFHFPCFPVTVWMHSLINKASKVFKLKDPVIVSMFGESPCLWSWCWKRNPVNTQLVEICDLSLLQQEAIRGSIVYLSMGSWPFNSLLLVTSNFCNQYTGSFDCDSPCWIFMRPVKIMCTIFQ